MTDAELVKELETCTDWLVRFGERVGAKENMDWMDWLELRGLIGKVIMELKGRIK
jgi:hypothetical protein